MIRVTMLLALCALGVLALGPIARAAGQDPVFHLSFDQGLLPDVGPDAPCQWAAQWSAQAAEPPQFYKEGLTGSALLITDNPASAGMVAIPATITDALTERGTFTFWLRGMQQWNLWSMGEDAKGGCYVFMGGGMIYKWNWYAEIALFGHGPTLFYQHFDQYQWTQLGVTWQREGDGKTRNRIYLNGKLVGEASGALDIRNLRFGSTPLEPGGRLLIDECTLWNRVLTEPEMKRLYRQNGQWANTPIITASRLATAPTIDGRISPAEWSTASRLTGLLEAATGEIAIDQSAFYLGYDDRFLYLAMIGEMTELARTNPAAVIERFLRAEQTGRSDKVATDDVVELLLSPEYWKADDHRTPGAWNEYRLLANAAGGYDARAYRLKGIDASWKVNGQTASTVGASGWQFEARIPLDALGTKPAPGDRWGLQLGRHWQHLKQQRDLWAWGSRATPDPAISAKRSEQYVKRDVPEQPDLVQRMHLHAAVPAPHAAPGVLRFAGPETPVVQVERIGNLGERLIDFSAVITNPAPAEQKVAVRLYTDTDALQYTDTLTLPPNGRAEVHKRQEIADYATSRLVFEVADATGIVIHRTVAPVYLKQSFGVWLAQRPNYENFLLDLDLGTLSNVPASELRVDVQLTDAAGGVAFAEKDRRVSSYVARLEYPAKGIACGDYALVVAIRHGDVVLAHETLDFTQHTKAPWYGNRYGCEDMDLDVVPYPWTDMKVDKETVQVWGREYRFGKSLFPEQITTLEAPMLRAPVRVVLNTQDGETLDSAVVEAKGEWTKSHRTRVEGTRTITGNACSLTHAFWAEYDGLLWSTLTLAPQGKVNVASMAVEIPLHPAFTDVIKASALVGVLKPEGYQQVLGPVWLGNGDGGIQWLPGEGNLHVRDKNVIRVDVTPEGAMLRIVLIDTPTELDAPYTVQFGMNVTPVRPNITRTPFFRARSTRGGGPFYPKGLESLPAADPGTDFYGYGSKAGNLYVWTASVSTAVDAAGTDDFKRYGAEWMSDPFQRPQRGWETDVVFPTTSSDSFRDYFIWRYWRYQQKYGYAGHYCDNPGGGSTLEVRELLKRLYNVTSSNLHFAAREANIGIASNGGFNMGFGGFFTYQWDGEHLNSHVSSQQPTYRGILNPGAYRAEYMGHNYGWPVYFLGQARIKPEWVQANGGPEAVIDHVQGLELLHDVQPSGWHFPGPMDQVCQRAQNAVKEHNLFHWIYQFTPYWKQDIVTLPDKDMHASLYIARPSKLASTNPRDEMGYPWGHRAVTFRHYFNQHLPGYIITQNFYDTEAARDAFTRMPDTAVLIVYNNTEWEGEMRLKVDWQKLGLGAPDTLTVTNAVHSTGFRLEKGNDADGKEIEKAVFFERPEEFAKIENGELVFPMTQFNYRMIVIGKE
jgi:hypothetical protein